MARNLQMTSPGWLLLQSDNPGRVFGSSYEDVFQTKYQWDSKVPHSKDIKVGDLIGVWDGKRLLGVSCISEIVMEKGVRTLPKCKFCTSGDIFERKTLSPIYRCRNCKKEFDDPYFETFDVDTYTAHYETGWKEIPSFVGREILEPMWVGKSQHAMRNLHPRALERLLKDQSLEVHFNYLVKLQKEYQTKTIQGGFKSRVAKSKKNKFTWNDTIYQALIVLGKPSKLNDIYSMVREIRDDHQLSWPKNAHAIIRKEIETRSSDSETWRRVDDIYQNDEIGSGIWSIREFGNANIPNKDTSIERRRGPSPRQKGFIVSPVDPSISQAVTYIMRFGNSQVFKVGRTSRIEKRLEQLNEHIPHAHNELPELPGWHLMFLSDESNDQEAHDRESEILERVRFVGNNTVGERFVCDEGEVFKLAEEFNMKKNS